MRPTWLLLLLINICLAGASAYVVYHAPGLWNGQAQVYFGLVGMLFGIVTVLFCSASLVFGSGEGGAGLHGLMGLLFVAAQGYGLWHFGRDAGIVQFIRHALRL